MSTPVCGSNRLLKHRAGFLLLLVKRVRGKLGLTQVQFADLIGVSFGGGRPRCGHTLGHIERTKE
jgi:DNA-binding XRE family transcriptional regulator